MTNKVMGRFRRAALPRSLLKSNLDSVARFVNGTCVLQSGTVRLVTVGLRDSGEWIKEIRFKAEDPSVCPTWVKGKCRGVSLGCAGR